MSNTGDASGEARAATPSGPNPSVSGVAGIPIAELLYDLPQQEVRELTNHYHLPKARGASEPFVWRGGSFPCPDGTKISTWYPGVRTQRCSGYWTPATAKSETWRHVLRRDGVVIFRYRDEKDCPRLNGSKPIVDPVDRVADVLERIAAALERLAPSPQLQGTEP